MSIEVSRCELRGAGLHQCLWFCTLLNWHVKRAPTWANSLSAVPCSVQCTQNQRGLTLEWMWIKRAHAFNISFKALIHKLILSFLFIGSKAWLFCLRFLILMGYIWGYIWGYILNKYGMFIVKMFYCKYSMNEIRNKWSIQEQQRAYVYLNISDSDLITFHLQEYFSYLTVTISKIPLWFSNWYVIFYVVPLNTTRL